MNSYMKVPAWATFLVVIIGFAGCIAFVDCKASKGPKKLEFFLHENTGSEPSEMTDVITSSPSGNYSYYKFGNFGVTEQVITKNVSPASQIIGSAPGTFQPNKKEGEFALWKTLTLKTEEYSGTLVVFCNWVWDAPTNEFAVLGGTGTFRMARGYAITRILNETEYTLTHKWNVFLEKDSLCSR